MFCISCLSSVNKRLLLLGVSAQLIGVVAAQHFQRTHRDKDVKVFFDFLYLEVCIGCQCPPVLVIGLTEVQLGEYIRFLSIHNQLKVNFLKCKNVVQNVQNYTKHIRIKFIGPVNFVHVCFQSAPVNLRT